jgi:hypothetical protein
MSCASNESETGPTGSIDTPRSRMTAEISEMFFEEVEVLMIGD